MKKISALIILCLIVLSSCSSDEVNTAPTVPGLDYPTNNLLCIGNTILFKWYPSTDDQNDQITYLIEIATDNTFTQDLKTGTTTGVTKSFTLAKGKLYYWRVKATDSKDESSEYSVIYSFYTQAEGEINHVPFAPVLTAPSLKTIQTTNSVDLNWTATDADVADVLTYDVYFGMTNPPLDKVASDISLNSFTVDVPTVGDYYWKVVVKDDRGASTAGQVWFFTKE